MPVSHPHIVSRPTWSVTLWLIVVCALTVPASAQTDYWERANGPYGGTAVRDLEMSDDGLIYAATANGVFRSSDDGLTWEGFSDGLISVDIRDLHIRDDGSIWAASYGAGLFKRSPLSSSWQLAGLQHVFLSALIEPVPGLMIAGSNGYVYRSEDSGASWQAKSLDGFSVNVQDLSFNSEYYFAATSLGIFRSNDSGQTWEFASFGLQEYDVLTVETNAEGHVFAGSNPSEGGCAIYRSRGNGNIWTCIQPLTDPLTVPVLKMGPDGKLYAGGYRNLFNTDDEGNTWFTQAATGSSVESLLFTGTSLLVGTQGLGVYRSVNGGSTWESSNQGIQSRINSVKSLDDGRLIVGTEGGLFQSTDLGFSWRRVDEAEPLVQQITDVELDPDGNLVAATTAGLWRNSVNGGWEALGPPGMPSIRDIFIAEDATILAAYHAGVYLYSGGFWVASLIYGADQAPRDVSAVIGTSAGTIMAGAAWDSWRRELGSASWQLMTTIDTPWFDVQSFGVLGDRLLGGTRFTGVVESYDDGQTWHRLGTGLIGSEDIRAIQFNHQGVPHISTYGSGIFQLNPWSRSWLPMNTGLDGHLRVTSLAFDSYGNAFAGSLDGGLFRHIIAGVDTEEQVSLPSTLTLGNPYPNPAAHQITLPVLSPISGVITFELYDLLGRRVKSFEETVYGLKHDIRIDTSDLHSGIYMFRVRSGASSINGSFSVVN